MGKRGSDSSEGSEGSEAKEGKEKPLAEILQVNPEDIKPTCAQDTFKSTDLYRPVPHPLNIFSF